MVGVPRSKGCQTCLQRRTKCDESRPACGNCLKYGTVCPGYDRRLKFVAGKHAVRPRGNRQPAKAESGTSLPEFAPPRRPRPGPAATTSQDPEGWNVVVRTGRTLTTLERLQLAAGELIQPLSAPRESPTLFISTLIQSVQDTQPTSEFMPLGTWFVAIMTRLGCKSTLDSAICSFALHLLGKKNRDEQVIAQSRMLYGKSLYALRKALDHRTEWQTAETLGAATILCLYELFAGTVAPDSWMAHAAGVGRLMQSRGPKAHEEGWGRSILLSFRPIIIMNALFSGKDCFLADPSWQEVIQHRGAPSSTLGHAVFEDSIDFVDEFFRLLAKLPSILRYGYMLREANRHNLPVDISRVMIVSKAAETVRGEFEAWYPTILPMTPLPTEIPTKDPLSIYPTVLDYKSPWMGALHMGYWAAMLILQECLNQCVYPIDYSNSNQLFMSNILRSLETVGSGMMGGYRCGFSIRIAYEFADERTKGWIGVWLRRFEESYAATSSKTYPSDSWQAGKQ